MNAGWLEESRSEYEAGAAAGFRNCDPWWNPAAMAEVMALAQARGLQTDYVARLVAHRPPH